jgi:hypothetical protein
MEITIKETKEISTEQIVELYQVNKWSAVDNDVSPKN